MIITSTANPQIKQIRHLRDRKVRQETGLFYIEGLRIVTEALQQGLALEQLIIAPELLTSAVGQQAALEQARRNAPVLEVSADVFRSFSLKDGPQGIAAVARQQWQSLAAVSPASEDLWVALDSVADPGNLGTILRTTDSAGGQGVILLDQSTDPYDPTALRASMGAAFSQQLIRASFTEFLDWARRVQLPIIGAAGGSATDYHAYRYPTPLVLLMGSERQGLQRHHLDSCSAVVAIPMQGRSDSLNLAVATAVILYEIYNQRRAAA
ncbi:MAG TPA: RNA methyltransferase [Anaerolineaceae bacterium]|jgi:TrmH family RNA methyltransferase|nr:RNA methyltransferase [Anaerolineaceae bacterium]